MMLLTIAIIILCLFTGAYFAVDLVSALKKEKEKERALIEKERKERLAKEREWRVKEENERIARKQIEDRLFKKTEEALKSRQTSEVRGGLGNKKVAELKSSAPVRKPNSIVGAKSTKRPSTTSQQRVNDTFSTLSMNNHTYNDYTSDTRCEQSSPSSGGYDSGSSGGDSFGGGCD